MIRDFLVIVFLSIPLPYQKQPILAILPFAQSAPYSNRTIPVWGVNRLLRCCRSLKIRRYRSCEVWKVSYRLPGFGALCGKFGPLARSLKLSDHCCAPNFLLLDTMRWIIHCRNPGGIRSGYILA
jgi:hypothetical protein